MVYENLLQEAKQHGVSVYEMPMKTRIKGLYSDKTVWINKSLGTNAEKACILAEELGHYHTSSGNILNQADVRNRKQENRARMWAYDKLIPLSSLVKAHHAGVRNRFELAEYLGVTEEFVDAVLSRYKEKYGVKVTLDRYIICFDPLVVLEILHSK